MSKRLLLSTLVVLVGLASACPKHAKPVAWADPDRTVPCPKLSKADLRSGSSRNDGTLQLTSLAKAKFTSKIVGIGLSGRYLTYAKDDKVLMACDLQRGKVATLATAVRPDGVITWINASRSTVAYMSDAEQSTTWTSWDWTIDTVDIATGEHRQWLSGHTGYGDLPLPEIDWPWLVWRESRGGVLRDPPTYSAVWTVDLRTGRKRRVAEVPRISRVVVSRGRVFFDADGVEPGTRELFRVPADGSTPPVQVTHQGFARPPDAGNGRIVWLSEKEGTGGERWTMPAGGSTPVRTIPSHTFPRPGPDFLLEGFDALFVADLRHPDAELLGLPGDPSPDKHADWVVDGNLIAWVTVDDPKHPHESTRHLRIARADRR